MGGSVNFKRNIRTIQTVPVFFCVCLDARHKFTKGPVKKSRQPRGYQKAHTHHSGGLQEKTNYRLILDLKMAMGGVVSKGGCIHWAENSKMLIWYGKM